MYTISGVGEQRPMGEIRMVKIEVPEETRDTLKLIAVLSKRPMWRVVQEAVEREEKERRSRQEQQGAVR